MVVWSARAVVIAALVSLTTAASAYTLQLSQNGFKLASGDYEAIATYDSDGLSADVKAWNDGRVTQYTVSQHLYIRPETGDLARVEEVEVEVTVTQVGNGHGCATIVLVSPWTYLFEICGGSETLWITMKTNTRYRMEANASAISMNGSVVEHFHEIRLALPSEGDPVASLVATVADLPPAVLRNANQHIAYSNKVEDVLDLLADPSDTESLYEALSQLEHDLLAKTDGCVDLGAPDRNDWVRDCTHQLPLYDAILDVMDHIDALLAD